jgi:MarR family transcriptional regulator, 2-MHQ and catechol-resistance regulon repressor
VRALDAYIKLVRGTESVTRRIHEHLARADLTVSQFGVLEALFHLGPLSQRELGAKVLKSPGNVTMVLGNLEERGLVRRDRTIRNKRTCVVDLTPAGRRMVAKIFPRHVEAVVRELSTLSAGEQEMLGALCKKIGLDRRRPDR